MLAIKVTVWTTNAKHIVRSNNSFYYAMSLGHNDTWHRDVLHTFGKQDIQG